MSICHVSIKVLTCTHIIDTSALCPQPKKDQGGIVKTQLEETVEIVKI